jgi:hypothetical protein
MGVREKRLVARGVSHLERTRKVPRDLRIGLLAGSGTMIEMAVAGTGSRRRGEEGGREEEEE